MDNFATALGVVILLFHRIGPLELISDFAIVFFCAVAFLPYYFRFVCLQISTIPYLHMVLIGILRAYFILMVHTLCYIHIY